jgi:1,4-dihydroxy-2-naphthoate octaprenyltransferase
MNVAMWGKALWAMPTVSKEEWARLDLIARWLVATRAAVFLMTAVSAGVGGMLALRDGNFHTARFIVCLVGLVFAHATNNLINDLTDSFTGVDKDNYFRTQYGPQPLEAGLLSLKEMWAYVAVTGAVALGCGAWLVWDNPLAMAVMGAGAVFVLFYTWPLKHIGLGEPAVLAVWGPLMIGGTYLVITGIWSWDVAWISVAYAIGPTTVLFGKHTDKLEPDREKGIRTLPVILGEPLSRWTTILLFVAQPLVVTALVATGLLGWPMLIIWLSGWTIVQAVRVFAKPRPTERPADFPAEAWPTYLAAHAFVANRRTGTLFLVGLVLELVMTRAGYL